MEGRRSLLSWPPRSFSSSRSTLFFLLRDGIQGGAVFPAGLAGVHRLVGPFEYGFEIRAVIGVTGYADANGYFHCFIARRDRSRSKRFSYAFGHPECPVTGSFRQQYHEFIASVAGNQVRRAHRILA